MSGSKQKKYDLVAIGGATQDVFVQSDLSKVVEIREPGKKAEYLAFPYGRKIDVQHVLFMTGGGGTNVAVSAAKQGLKVACVGSIGDDDAGKSISTRLERDGVDASQMVRIPDVGTAYSVILTSFEGDRTVLVFRGAGERLTFDLLKPNLDKILDTKWLFVGNLGKASDAVFPPLFAEAKKRGIKIAFNPGMQTLQQGLSAANREILNGVEVLLLNREESLILHGKPDDVRYDWLQEEALYKELLLSLRSVGVSIPVITDGFRGAHALSGDDYIFCPTFKVTPVSTLGAGDAFGSTLVSGLQRYGTENVGKALIEASANAASVIQGFGAKKRLLTAEGIQQFISDYSAKQPREYEERIKESAAPQGEQAPPPAPAPLQVVRRNIQTLGLSPSQSH